MKKLVEFVSYKNYVVLPFNILIEMLKLDKSIFSLTLFESSASCINVGYGYKTDDYYYKFYKNNHALILLYYGPEYRFNKILIDLVKKNPTNNNAIIRKMEAKHNPVDIIFSGPYIEDGETAYDVRLKQDIMIYD